MSRQSKVSHQWRLSFRFYDDFIVTLKDKCHVVFRVDYKQLLSSIFALFLILLPTNLRYINRLVRFPLNQPSQPYLLFFAETAEHCSLVPRAPEPMSRGDFLWKNPGGGGGGGTPLYGLYGDVPLDRVWFLAPLP